MRMRRKPYARPELAATDFFIDEPKEHAGRWKEMFANAENSMEIELGCGKGGFISKLSVQNSDINYLGFDIKSEVLVLAKRKICAEYKAANRPIDNVFIMSHDIERICEVLTPSDTVQKIYINFCNPWPKSRHQKRRLTHPRQLEKYKTFLAKGGEIHFKTDDDGLFEDSVEYFKQCGFEITYITRDLHADAEACAKSIMTEHEKMFSDEGIKIKALTAVLP